MTEKLLVPDIGDFENVEVIELLVKEGQENGPPPTGCNDAPSSTIRPLSALVPHCPKPVRPQQNLSAPKIQTDHALDAIRAATLASSVSILLRRFDAGLAAQRCLYASAWYFICLPQPGHVTTSRRGLQVGCLGSGWATGAPKRPDAIMSATWAAAGSAIPASNVARVERFTK